MQIDRKTILTVLITLIVGVGIGALFFGGNSTEQETALEEHSHSEGELWTCSMHPQVRQAEPGSCPFCGMDLIPVAEGGDADNPKVLKMSNAALQLANIQTEKVGSFASESNLMLNGRIKPDQRLVQTQTTHFAGRIEKLYKDYEGEFVSQDEKVASIYSPELMAAQNELIEAKKMADTNPMLLEAARKKLKHWKVTDEQLNRIEKTGQVMMNFDLLSNYQGVITKKLVNNGAHLMEGGAIYQVADLSKVWAVFEVYEKDLAKVKVGDQIMFQPNGSNQTYQAKISFISPAVEAGSRVVEIRADINNASGELKPDMFIKAKLVSSNTSEVSVPQSAVLWTGKRSIVYVKLPNNEGFELREVELGNKYGEFYQVVSGLQTGEEVVTNGAFTLDAESQLKGKISMMNPEVATVENPEIGFKEIELPKAIDYSSSTSTKFQEQLQELTKSYVILKDAMVEGNARPIRDQALKVTQTLKQIDMSLVNGAAHVHWMALLDPMEESLAAINNSNDRDEQRLQFINLSKAIINALDSFGVAGESKFYVQFCPMANNDQGATWVSLNEEIVNPYFGDLMLHCGSLEYTIESK